MIHEVGVARDAEEKGGGAAGGGAVVVAVVGVGARVRLELGLFAAIGGERVGEDRDGQGEMVRGGQARVHRGGTVDSSELLRDLGLAHPEGERVERGVVDLGDGDEGDGGGGQIFENLGRDFGGGEEGGHGGRR